MSEKDELYQKYIVENLSRKDCAKYFNVSETYIKRKIKEYGFSKSKEQINKLISDSNKIFLDKNLLYDFYIVKNFTIQECADMLGVKFHIVKRRLKDYGIKKPQNKFKEVHKTHANQTKNSLAKRKLTTLDKYGVDNVSQNRYVKDKKEKTTQEHYGVDNPFSSKDIKRKISNTIQNKYGVPYACMRQECRKYSGNNSKPNQFFANILNNLKIEYIREYSLENYSYDFKVENLLFEIDPTVFHNSTFSPVGLPKSKTYHVEKSQIARKYNLHCIHIFDWDDEEKIIKTFLVPKQKIYARECIIKYVSKQEAKQFLNQNHLQGYAQDLVRIGLYYDNELVQIMTFDKPRYNKNYTWELIRFCSIKNVVGGAEKLLKAFENEHEDEHATLISYCDLSKFDGKIYQKLGFSIVNKPEPSKHWVNLKTGQHITDNLLRQKGFDQLFKTNYGKGTSNEQLMFDHDFVEVYDCGQLAFAKSI